MFCLLFFLSKNYKIKRKTSKINLNKKIFFYKMKKKIIKKKKLIFALSRKHFFACLCTKLKWECLLNIKQCAIKSFSNVEWCKNTSSQKNCFWFVFCLLIYFLFYRKLKIFFLSLSFKIKKIAKLLGWQTFIFNFKLFWKKFIFLY